MTERTPTLFFILAIGLAASACRKDEITSTWVEKQTSPNHPATKQSDTTADPSSQNSIQWVKPDAWRAVPPSSMRVASFAFLGKSGPSADISVVRLAGDGGGILANVNRWRGQLQLSPINEAELKKSALSWKVDGHPMLVVDFTSQSNADSSGPRSRMMAAIYSLGNESWYVKMTGDEKTLEEGKAGFLAFLKSIQHPH